MSAIGAWTVSAMGARGAVEESSAAPIFLKRDRVLPAKGYVTGLAWSRDGSRIAAIGNYGRTITVWNSDGSALAEFSREGKYIGYSIAFLSNDIVLTTASIEKPEDLDLVLSLWDVKTKARSRAVKGPARTDGRLKNGTQNFAISADGQFVVVVPLGRNEPVTLYSTRDWAVAGSVPVNVGAANAATAVAISSDGRTLATALTDGSVKLFDLKDQQAEPSVIVAYPNRTRGTGVSALSLSPDGRFLITGATGSLGLPVNDGSAKAVELAHELASVKIWRTSDKTLVASYPDALAPISQFSWSPDSRYVAAVQGEMRVNIFSPLTSERPVAATPDYGFVTSASFSPDGTQFAIGADDSVILFKVSH